MQTTADMVALDIAEPVDHLADAVGLFDFKLGFVLFSFAIVECGLKPLRLKGGRGEFSVGKAQRVVKAFLVLIRGRVRLEPLLPEPACHPTPRPSSSSR